MTLHLFSSIRHAMCRSGRGLCLAPRVFAVFRQLFLLGVLALSAVPAFADGVPSEPQDGLTAIKNALVPPQPSAEQPAPPPPPRWVFETLPPWEKLEEGLQLGLFSAQFDGGDPFEVVFLRIDPAYFDFTVETASSEKQSLPLEAWATRKGLIKRTELKDFENLRRSGLIAIVLREEDELIGVALTDGTRDVLLGTRGGMAIRFSETDVRVMGRVSMGVKSIELAEGDEVVAMSIVEEGEQVLSITRNGFGKRTEIDEYRVQSRGGKGIKAMNLTEKTGLLAGQLLVDEDEDILLITDDGTVIRTPVSSISTHGRNTQGVRIMRVEEGSQVVCVAPAEAEEDEEGEAELPPLEDAEELSAETDETDETEAQPEGEDDDI